MRILIAALIALAMLAIGVAEAASGIVVEHPWARATPGGAPNGAAYVGLPWSAVNCVLSNWSWRVTDGGKAASSQCY